VAPQPGQHVRRLGASVLDSATRARFNGGVQRGSTQSATDAARAATPFDRPSPTSPPLEILDDPEALDAFYAQFAPEGSEL
jgi:hypothetical protein